MTLSDDPPSAANSGASGYFSQIADARGGNGRSADEIASILRTRGLSVPDEWLIKSSMTPLDRWLRQQIGTAPRIVLPQQAP
jgi:hypothetical protein